MSAIPYAAWHRRPYAWTSIATQAWPDAGPVRAEMPG